jgi:hypothetical protein
MAKKGRGSRFTKLLDDPEVRRWYENNARGSVVTADVYLRRLGNFCEAHSSTPKKFAARSEKEIYGVLLDYVSKLEKEGKSGSYISSIMKALKSWLAFNDKEVKRKIKIRGADATPTLKDERIPTPRELKSILMSGDKKTRVACVLVAHSGFRLQSLGTYLGDNGLRVGDFPELRIDGDHIDFSEVPAMIVVRPELSKAGHKYITFLSEEGCDYLKEYLEERMRAGEELSNRSSIVRPKTAAKDFISTTNIGDTIRHAIRKAGFSWRPYVLRSYFDTQLMLAESKGHLLRDYRTLWMGHKGDIEHIQEFLQTKEPKRPEEEELKRMFRGELLRMAGYDDNEMEKDGLLELPEDKFRQVVRERLLSTGTNSNGNQKVITMEEIETVTTLPNNKVVVGFSF